MSGLVWSVIFASVLAKVIRFVLPKENEVTKYVSLFFSFCLTAIVALPLVDIVSGIGEIGNWFSFIEEDIGDKEGYGDIFESTLDGALSPSAEEYIYSFLAQNYGISSENAIVDVVFSVEGDVLALKSVTVLLKGSAVFANTGEITRLLEEKLLCDVIISVDID